MKELIKETIKDLLLKISSRLFKHRRLTLSKTDADLIKVNLGCGLRCLPDWVNVDGSLVSLLNSRKYTLINKLLYRLAGSSAYYTFEAFNHILQSNMIYFQNLVNGIPLDDESADIVYSSHFLEHLTKDDGVSFLSECHRILKPGGLLRLLTPDLDIAFEQFKTRDSEAVLDQFFYTSPKFDFSAHKYLYNFPMLKNRLEAIGFKDIQKMAFQKGNCPDIDFLDIYPEYSICIECYK